MGSLVFAAQVLRKKKSAGFERATKKIKSKMGSGKREKKSYAQQFTALLHMCLEIIIRAPVAK
ncbi:MAG: hypothetical protein JST18_04845 [Bacteroidetes bacterium]|nr:hypothetical protein [Bacteroidota bacterium]